jgi:hypothetical protein
MRKYNNPSHFRCFSRIFPAIFLMMLGLICRLVAGSIPIPPVSPFSSPETHFISQGNHAVHYDEESAAAVVSFAKTGKKNGHRVETHVTSWYGLLAVNPVAERDLSPLDSFSLGIFSKIASPDLGTNLRPPSC